MLKKILAFIVLVLLVSSVAGYFFLFSPPSKETENIRIVVKKGAIDSETIAALEENKLFRSRYVFEKLLNYYCRKPNCDSKNIIIPGGYMLNKNLRVWRLVKQILNGPYQKWVTIPPGKRKEQTGVIIKRELGWTDNMLLSFISSSNEGMLYPDTYLFDIDADPKEISTKMISNFNSHFTPDLQTALLQKNIRNDTALTFASLIERESGGAEDKPVIAGIIWNRIEKKMRLEIDATVQYAITTNEINSLIANNQSLAAEDFNFWSALPGGLVRRVNSEYNTYRIPAFPPSPICSPSIDSLRAVAFPANTDALYYLHSSDKQIHTAKTYKEHLDNIEKYLNN